MSEHRAVYSIRVMCRVLDVSASGYYAWERREPSARARANERLLGRIRAIQAKSRGTYGAPRVIAELREPAAGESREFAGVGHNRVARLMREAGLVGASRRKGCWTTRRDRDARPAPDLVERKFVADAPDKLWVADITYIPTWTGFLFLAVVLDVFSRRIVGWAMANHLRTELILEALNMAIARRRPQDVIHHSDQGCQYTSIAFGSRCREAGVRPSTGSTGDCFDNAMCESFFATLECELLARYKFHSQAQAMPIVFEFIEGWYNTHRRHSALGQIAPLEFERRHEARSKAVAPKTGFQGSLRMDDHVHP
jgi:putative transposase